MLTRANTIFLGHLNWFSWPSTKLQPSSILTFSVTNEILLFSAQKKLHVYFFFLINPAYIE